MISTRSRRLVLATLLFFGPATLAVADDCNGNGVPDEVDVADGTSADCNANGIPDECDVAIRLPREVIAEGTEAAVSVVVIGADLDGDGDPDAVSGSVFDGKIAWYENIGGTSFGPQRIAAILTSYPESIFAADVDGDDDVDLLFASFAENKIGWLENRDGLGDFGPQRIITQAALGAEAVFGGDIDDDGDIDVIAGSSNDDTISWFENLDGAGNFGNEQLITTFADHPEFVLGADLDGDGDLDMVSASQGNDVIGWSENLNGAGNFGNFRTISAQANGAFHVAVGDLDGDGDNDVMSASSLDNKIAWYENLDGQGQFGPQQVLGTSTLARGVAPVDIDNDLDLDVVFVAVSQGRVGVFENLDGAGTFGPLVTIFDEGSRAEFVFPVDIDGDGDSDLLTGGDEVAFHRNETDDCNGNGVPDVCDPDCNVNQVPDACDVARGARDCNGNVTPDICETVCLLCDADGDLCADDLDCLPSDPDFWARPGAASRLMVERTANLTRVTWEPPAFTGGASIHFDALRASSSSDFEVATCVESDGSDLAARDVDGPPPSGAVYFYLIRVENACPGDGAMGVDSTGVPRVGRACP